ncbi:MAG: hypothetical protein J6K26_00965 [Lachnospiraceae bacterium]|nr:hypothetical protein [Lachnospiraceae bacterium]
MKLYLAVTADYLELPLYVTSNVVSLAEKFGVSVNCVQSSITHGRNGRVKGIKFIRVEIDEKEQEK